MLKKPKKPDITKKPYPIKEEIWAWEEYKTMRLSLVSLLVSVLALLKIILFK